MRFDHWPDHEVPDNLDHFRWFLHMREIQDKQARAGSAGMQRSVAAALTFENMLAYIECKRVNPMGMLRHIRFHRRRALCTHTLGGMEPKAFFQYRMSCKVQLMLMNLIDRK